MEDKDKAVGTTQEAATETEVKKEEAAASPSETVNLAEALEKTLEKLGKTEEERDNYKTGLLRAKGKIEVEEDADLEDRLLARLRQGLKDEERAKGEEERDEITKKLIQRNKELEEAVKNKTTVATAGVGASSETTTKVSDNMLSEAQLNELRGRGWDDEKIARFKQNLSKIH